jgi:hypothetical protein
MSLEIAWETWEAPLSAYLRSFRPLIGDQRTANTFAAVVYGILAAGSTICQRIADHSPELATSSRGAQPNWLPAVVVLNGSFAWLRVQAPCVRS